MTRHEPRARKGEGTRTPRATPPPPFPCYPGGGVTTAPLANGGLFSSPRPSRSPDAPARGPHTAAHASQRAPRAALGANRAATLASGPPAGAFGCVRPPRSRVVARSARARRSGRARWGRAWSGRSLRGTRAGRWVLASRRALPSPGRAARAARRCCTYTHMTRGLRGPRTPSTRWPPSQIKGTGRPPTVCTDRRPPSQIKGTGRPPHPLRHPTPSSPRSFPT